MIEIVITAEDGFVIHLDEFKAVLREISTESRAWWVRVGKIDPARPHILVGYRDTVSPDLVNDLCFILPLVNPGGPEVDAAARYVVAHPEALTPELVGYYQMEDGSLRQDDIADFENFWIPMREIFAKRAKAGKETPLG